MPAVQNSLSERFDQLRQAHPDCGFALYAYTPGDVVTLEIITPEAGATPYQFVGKTAAEAMALAFPLPDSEPASEPEASASIFD